MPLYNGNTTAGNTFQAETSFQTVLATYRAVFSATVPGAGQAIEFIGSASNTVTITKIFIAQPSVAITLTLDKQSAASTAGASSTILPDLLRPLV